MTLLLLLLIAVLAALALSVLLRERVVSGDLRCGVQAKSRDGPRGMTAGVFFSCAGLRPPVGS